MAIQLAQIRENKFHMIITHSNYHSENQLLN